MFVDESIKTSEMPTEMVEHLKVVKEYLRKEFGGGCAISIDGMVHLVFYV